ncbi:hypothetical protein SAMN05216428_105209 [Nitrosospira sp. Nsp11]|uniref:hypothetical protein n=1 Tax=Nitrosospira sp. Nsp11 TaxID=1855338 RepID=UPI0009220403|nr:hypothetical protein [Nitrosospira sp. Nsp11]SHL74682.1 hypothetical protein SAMN05216428_105209 [Nitrosospira sp. Nsp11]
MQIVLSDNAGMAGFLDDLNRVHPDGCGLIQVIRSPPLIALPDKTYYYKITSVTQRRCARAAIIAIPSR